MEARVRREFGRQRRVPEESPASTPSSGVAGVLRVARLEREIDFLAAANRSARRPPPSPPPPGCPCPLCGGSRPPRRPPIPGSGPLARDPSIPGSPSDRPRPPRPQPRHLPARTRSAVDRDRRPSRRTAVRLRRESRRFGRPVRPRARACWAIIDRPSAPRSSGDFRPSREHRNERGPLAEDPRLATVARRRRRHRALVALVVFLVAGSAPSSTARRRSVRRRSRPPRAREIRPAPVPDVENATRWIQKGVDAVSFETTRWE